MRTQMPRMGVRLTLTLLLLAGVAACGGAPEERGLPRLPASPTFVPDEDRGFDDDAEIPDIPVTEPIPGSKLAVFEAEDETVLVGRVFAQGERSGVVLLHSSDQDMRAWFVYAQQLMADGYSVLAFDFRGYGQSEGEPDPRSYPQDVEAAVQYLTVTGSERVLLVGTEVGGTAAVAHAAAAEFAGVVAVGAGPSYANLDATEQARSLRIPALVVDVGAGGEQSLADLIEDASTTRVTDLETHPEEESKVQEALTSFIHGNLPA